MDVLDWIIILAGLVVGIVIGLLVRRKNNEYLKSETKLGQPERVLRLDTQPIANFPVYHWHSLAKGSSDLSQSTSQHQEQETTRKKHGQD